MGSIGHGRTATSFYLACGLAPSFISCQDIAHLVDNNLLQLLGNLPILLHFAPSLALLLSLLLIDYDEMQHLARLEFE